MNFKNLFLIAGIATLLYSNLSIAQDREEIRYIKNNKKQPNIAYQQELRHSQSWQNFFKNNGEWYVVFNETNQLPHRAYGKPIHVSGATLEEKALNFISNQLSEFNISIDALKLQNAFGSEKYDYVNFYETYNGLKILDSRLTVKMTKNGDVILFGADVYNDLDNKISTIPSLSANEAASMAKQGIGSTITSVTVSPDLFILPIPDENKTAQNKYKLIYEVYVNVKDIDALPIKYRTFVDAQTGAILYRKNQIHTTGNSTTNVNVNGTVTIDNPYKGNTEVNMPNIRSVVSSTTYNTDSIGNLNLTGNPSSGTFYLDGLWSDVELDNGSTTANMTYSLDTNGTNSVSFDSSIASIRERSAYYHVNIVHDHMKKYLPSFPDMDIVLPTYVDVTGAGTCNAYYDGSSINFLKEGGGCYCLAQIGGVVYHEYGHGISDKFYQWQNSYFENGAMGEGYSDVWAFSITLDPVLSKGYETTDSTTYIRRYDEDIKVYPQDLVGEVHADGEIIGGAWWDTYQNFGSMDKMLNLFTESLYGLVTGTDGTEGSVFTDILIEVLTDDDDDADLTNGTPNDSAIVEAFARHGITLLSNAEVEHSIVDGAAAGAAITINADITLTYAWALNKASLYYYLNSDTSNWNSVDMINTVGSTYSADIPAQPNGTVIGYYLALEDIYEKTAGVVPVAANENNPNLH